MQADKNNLKSGLAAENSYLEIKRSHNYHVQCASQLLVNDGPLFPIYTCPSVEMHDSKSFILTVKVSKFYNIIKALKIDEQMGLIVQKSL